MSSALETPTESDALYMITNYILYIYIFDRENDINVPTKELILLKNFYRITYIFFIINLQHQYVFYHKY